MIRRKLVLTAGATAAALCLAGGAAFAAVSATPIADTNGTAGYGALAPGVQTFVNVQSTEILTQYLTTVKRGVARRPAVHGPRRRGVQRRAGRGGRQPGLHVRDPLRPRPGRHRRQPVPGRRRASRLGDRHTFTGLGSVANTDDVWVIINVGDNCKIRHGHRHHYRGVTRSAAATATARTRSPSTRRT